MRPLASPSGLRIRPGRELRCESRAQLRSCAAAAVAQTGDYSSDSTSPAWEPPQVWPYKKGHARNSGGGADVWEFCYLCNVSANLKLS